jgi:hypothetical protein
MKSRYWQAHPPLTVSLINEIALLAYKPPLTILPVVRVILALAKIFPLNKLVVPKLAEVPTTKKTLHAVAPLIRIICALGPVVKVLGIRKINCAFGSFFASKVKSPVIEAD